MWMLIRPGAEAHALELAVSGGPVSDAESAALAGIVAELRAASEVTSPARGKEEARSRMLSAVSQAAMAESRAAAAPGRIRTAAISAAAVAGAGFVVAGATDTNPLSAVGGGVARIASIGEAPAPPAVEFTLEGIVTAVRSLPHGSALEVQTASGPVLVDVSEVAPAYPTSSRESLAEVFPPGASVRVRVERMPEGELPRALAIEVRPSLDAGGDPAPSRLRPDSAPRPPANEGNVAPASIETRPAEVPERTPAPRPTPSPGPTRDVRPAPVEPAPSPVPMTVRPEPTRPPTTANEPTAVSPTRVPEHTATPQSPTRTPTVVPTRTPEPTAPGPGWTISSDEKLRPAEEPHREDDSPATKPQSSNSTISDANTR